MLSKAQIIVLHTIKHSESGIVIQCYSNTVGRTALYLRVSPKNKVILSNLHRLNILDVVIYNNGSSMPTLKELAPAVKLESLRTNIYKNTIAIFISELLVRSIRESEGNPLLYEYLSSSINILEHIDEGVANFHIHFMTHFCKMMGFMPTDNYSPGSEYFDKYRALFCEGVPLYDPRTGTLRDAVQNGCFSRQESLLLHTLLNTRAIELSGIKCSGELRLSYAKQMISYLSYHLGSSLDIKSLDILHQVFN